MLVRTTFRERLHALIYGHWPKLRSIDERRFPGESEVVTDFVAAKFALEEVTSFVRPVTASLEEYHARLVTGPQSKFTFLTAEQFCEGLARLAAAAHSQALDEPQPFFERYDVVVVSRC
ncbi:hypothetical protein [Streptomyces violaceusniger]|uniref:Uncharacterized protein n=1 Tax=Streptomyces violaceusniger TaxID=68280 RepID=A0A4D4KZS4_STRVO|nr:hypothetical protein SVIO_026730 [Streptomyces violaceusniger]